MNDLLGNSPFPPGCAPTIETLPPKAHEILAGLRRSKRRHGLGQEIVARAAEGAPSVNDRRGRAQSRG